jgi:hypothetical protein
MAADEASGAGHEDAFVLPVHGFNPVGMFDI